MFNKKVLQEAILNIDAVKLERAYEVFLSYQNNQDLIKTLKEEEYQDGFLRKIFVECLGYTLKPDPNFNLTREEKNTTDGKKS